MSGYALRPKRVIRVVAAKSALRPVFPDNGRNSGHSDSAEVPHQLRTDRTSRHSPWWCSSRAAAYQRPLSSSSTPQPTFLAR